MAKREKPGLRPCCRSQTDEPAGEGGLLLHKCAGERLHIPSHHRQIIPLGGYISALVENNHGHAQGLETFGCFQERLTLPEHERRRMLGEQALKLTPMRRIRRRVGLPLHALQVEVVPGCQILMCDLLGVKPDWGTLAGHQQSDLGSAKAVHAALPTACTKSATCRHAPEAPA